MVSNSSVYSDELKNLVLLMMRKMINTIIYHSLYGKIKKISMNGGQVKLLKKHMVTYY